MAPGSDGVGKRDVWCVGGALLRVLITGPEGKPVSRREAAVIIHSRQMTRAEERAMLQAGGLDPVEGGEVASEVTVEVRRRWFAWVRRR